MTIDFFLSPGNVMPNNFANLTVILNRFVPLTANALAVILGVPIVVLNVVGFNNEFLTSDVCTMIMSSILISVFTV